jgi:hypothetical protein
MIIHINGTICTELTEKASSLLLASLRPLQILHCPCFVLSSTGLCSTLPIRFHRLHHCIRFSILGLCRACRNTILYSLRCSWESIVLRGSVPSVFRPSCSLETSVLRAISPTTLSIYHRRRISPVVRTAAKRLKCTYRLLTDAGMILGATFSSFSVSGIS